MALKFNPAMTKPEEKVVISGIAGKFPESDNVEEFKNNLMNKVDMITDNSSRYPTDHMNVQSEGGKIRNLSKFDGMFFGIHIQQSHAMDPMGRILLETTYEAIIDAGINPKTLKGSNTGVIIAACISETEGGILYKTQASENKYRMIGMSKSMLANRISYFFGLHGPSYTIDTACSSSMTAIDQGYRLIQQGLCDAVIVGGANLCLLPQISVHFFNLGVLSKDCRCKSFDSRANGYVRSEAICTIILQKARNAKRIYAHVIHSKTNCDGYKEQGITFPSTEVQKILLREVYEECNVSPNDLAYLEAHATGTVVGDPEELNAIDHVFCKGRSTPLKIGSVKSNMGHAEASSGLCSVIKVIIAMETGLIPPNLHLKNPTKGVKCLEEGKLKVITKPTPWEGGYVGVNSFGFGGANAHILLKSFTKEKVNNGAPSDDLPRLVAVSGRTQEAVETLLGHVESIPVDVEYIRLLHDIHNEDISGHMFRGYTLIDSKTSDKPPREVQQYLGVKRPIWFVFSGMGSQWPGMGEALMKFPIFYKAIQKCDAVLKPHGVDIFDILTNKDKKTFDNILNSFVGIAAIQIGLVDLLTSVGIKPDNIIGHSVGELGCAYADGCFTAEQMVLAAYSRGLASIETKMIRGSMAAIGLGYQQMKDLCPPDIEVACHNSSESSTISGPAESMKKFVAELTAKNIFAREVPCSNIAYHSRYIAEAGTKLLEYLKKVIPEPKPRSSKWLSTSVPQHQWSKESAKYSSAEYHTNNLLSSVLFEETATMIPSDAIAIEIAPHGLLQAIVKRSLGQNVVNVPLTQRGHKDNAEYFLQALGKLYNAGLQPQLANLYPYVEFPVSRGTPMISPYMRWEHSQDVFVLQYSQSEKLTTAERTIEINLLDDNLKYMAHHVIDGRTLIPATGYLVLVWETFSMMQGKPMNELSIIFEDVKFERATNISQGSDIFLSVMITRGSGKFEISESSTTVVTGMIREMSNPSKEMIDVKYLKPIEDDEPLTSKDIYKELKLRGYGYTEIFCSLKSASIGATKGHITWRENWSAFMDNMLQLQILGLDTRALYVPTGILKLAIDVKAHNEIIQRLTEETKEIPVSTYKDLNLVIAGGIQIRGIKANSIQRRKPMAVPVLEEYKFVANRDGVQTSLEEMIILSTHLALESHITTTPKILELIHQEEEVPFEETLTPIFMKVLSNLPMVRPNLILCTKTNPSEELSLPENVTIIEENKLPVDASVFMAAARNVISSKRSDILEQLIHATEDLGFILLQENGINKDTFSFIEACGLNIVLEKSLNKQTLLLLKKEEKPPQKTEVVYVDNNEFSWIERVKTIMKNEKDKKTHETVRLVLVAEGDLENGLLGMVKCLRREPNGEIVKAVIIQDKNAPKFSLNDPFYAKQLDINIGYNVLRPGRVWGTYRHVPYPELMPVPVPHAYVNLKVRGDLSSIQWMEGPIQPDTKYGNIVKVVYASLNFRDVMLATGKLMPEAITSKRENADCLVGFEFSGIDSNGRRVMGFVDSKAISNLVTPDKLTVWPVPDEWSLEDAATIPSAYFTVLYAFFFFGKLKKGEKVLIHAGSGAVGQAAINLALAEGCEVFVTVGTPEKRKFIKETFPSIDDSHIGNSRDTSFEQMVMKETHGKGVDVVLNSLAEDKLQASVRCLGYRGRFLEIGKFDLAANNKLGMEIFLKEITFHGVLLDSMISSISPVLQEEMYHFINAQLKTRAKAIKPIVRKSFQNDQLEEAFRYMAAGKHIGKIVIKIADEQTPLNTRILAYPRFNAMRDKSYVLIGGLGGLGLEIADWLVLRGAKNLVMVSRSGIKTGYQRLRTEVWKSYGVKVLIISGVDASKTDDCEFILRSAEKQAPVDGIFNLAALLKDCLMENQTTNSFEESMKPKAKITKKLDEISRRICPKLRHFVVFSSLSCGRGTAGQTNYGMGNAVLERICERRVEEGLPGMAIQWGAVGDVGLAADLLENKQQLEIGGTLPQRISSCLEEFDKFMCQSRPIVASMIVAEKQANAREATTILEAVMNIMNISDLKTVGQNTPLPEIGLDSMMATEIRQILERDFEVSVTLQDVRNLTIAKLVEMSTEKAKKQVKQSTETVAVDTPFIEFWADIPSLIHDEYCIQLPVVCHQQKDEIFLIPGIEGSLTVFNPLIPNLKSPTVCLKTKITDTNESIEDMADLLLPQILARCKGRQNFVIVGYSFGSLIAIELVRKLEARSLSGQLILIDGSPDYMKGLKSKFLTAGTEDGNQNEFLTHVINKICSPTIVESLTELYKLKSWNDKLSVVVKYLPNELLQNFPLELLNTVLSIVYKRVVLIEKYNPSTLSPLKTPITLLKPTSPSVQMPNEDYGLSKLTQGKVMVHEIKGQHISILENVKVAKAMNGEPFDDDE